MKTKGLHAMALPTVVLAALLGFAGCSDQKKFDKPPVPVKIQTVESFLPTTGLKFSGTLVPREQVDLAFKVGGYVQDILKLPGPEGMLRDVQKGEHVPRGTVLATLRDTDYQAKLSHARSVMEESRASLGQALREFERAERLLQGEVLAKNEYDKAREKLDVSKARAAGAESQVEEARIQLQETVLKSPLDCVVASRLIERGTLVAPGTKAFVLADLSSVKAVFGIPDYLLGQVKPGDALTVTVEALQQQFRGIVTAVSPSADQKSRVFEVEITIPNPGMPLKDGMIASFQMEGAGGGGPKLAVPLNSLVRPPSDPQGFMVFVVHHREGKDLASGRKVTIGKVHGNKVVITDGLAVGERVVTTGATLIHEGAVVTVIP